MNDKAVIVMVLGIGPLIFFHIKYAIALIRLMWNLDQESEQFNSEFADLKREYRRGGLYIGVNFLFWVLFAVFVVKS